MWSIEISADAPEEEETEALREELDFDYIRNCTAELKRVVENYGPFTEVREKSSNSIEGEITRTYNNKRGWICNQLDGMDAKYVWTLFQDQVNGYSWLSSGYQKDHDAIISWFISEKPFEETSETLYLNTEFIITVFYTDDDENTSYWSLDVWQLIDLDEVSDEAILGCLAN